MTTNERPLEDSAAQGTSELAQIAREYGPFEGVRTVNGLTFDGTRV